MATNSYLDLTIALNSKVDLVSLVEQHGIKLKKRGKRHSACCPFHSEKTPSFFIDSQTQHYHCFGCGAHGYASHFLKNYLKMSGIEAIRYLADLTHTSLENYDLKKLQYEESQFEKTRTILSLATDFYVENLCEPDYCPQTNPLAIEYLIDTRGFTWKTLEKCKIGLSTPHRSLVEFFKKHHSNYTIDDLVQAGVAKRLKNRQVIDHFSGDRVIFPIFDSAGRVEMLSGRVIDDSKEPKYLHTPHQKNEILYGINMIPKDFKKLIVVEGNFDTLRGIEQNLPVIATLGGKCSEQQLQRLLELTNYGDKPIYLCLDSDSAGKNAAFETVKSSFKHVQQNGGLIKVVELPSDDGKKVDFDSFLLNYGNEELSGLLDSSVEASKFFKREFLKTHLPENFDFQTPEIQATLAKKLKSELKYLAEDDFKSNLINFCLNKQQKQDIVSRVQLKTNIIFWKETYRSGKPVLSIDELAFFDFLQQAGFGRYWLKNATDQEIQSIFINVNNQIVTEVSTEKIRDFVHSHVRSLPDKITKNFRREDLERILIRQAGIHFSEFRLKVLKPLDITFHKDTEKSAFFYYKNCFVRVTAAGITTHDYSELEGVIWQRQILKHNFNKLDHNEVENGVFTQFQKNICRPRHVEFDEHGEHGKRFLSLQCAIGYLLHRFRTSTRIPAVIFNDERITDEPRGRSGKGLTCRGISCMRSTVEINGKQFDPNYQHNFQNVKSDTNIIQLDDLSKKFDMENLFSILSNGITINIKGDPRPIEIPFSESPKIMMTTNYVLSGDSDSHAGRKWEIVVSSYYDVNFTPEIEFNMRLFEDFDPTEWSRFYNYMMLCVQRYLKHGIYKHTSEKLAVRKLIQATNSELIEFADELERDKWLDQAETFEHFKKQFSDYERVQQRTFATWLQKYAAYTQDIKLDKRKSNGKTLFCLSNIQVELHEVQIRQ